MAKPEKRVLKVVCSECGQPWGEHGQDPTLEDCVRLLKAELAKRPVYPAQWGSSTVQYGKIA